MVGASPPESALLRDKPTLDALNKMGIDVGTLGNHEFDRGVPELLRQVNGGQSTIDPTITFQRQNYPMVDANVISDKTGKPLLAPYVVKKIGGVKVAFIGATTITTPSIVTTGGTTACTSWTRRPPSTSTSRSCRARACTRSSPSSTRAATQSELPGRHRQRPHQRHRQRARSRGQGRHLRAQPHRARHAGRGTRSSSRRRRTRAPSTTCTCCSTERRAPSPRRGVRCSRRGTPRRRQHRSVRADGQAGPGRAEDRRSPRSRRPTRSPSRSINHAAADIPSQREGGATRGRRVTGRRSRRRRAAQLRRDAARVREHRQHPGRPARRAGHLRRPVHDAAVPGRLRRHVHPDRRAGLGVAEPAAGGGDRRHHADLRPALHLHRHAGQRHDHRRSGSARRATTRTRSRTTASASLHRHGQLVHGRRRRRVHRARVGEQHRADRRRRTGAAGRLRPHVLPDPFTYTTDGRIKQQ